MCVLCSPGWVHWGRRGSGWPGFTGRCLPVYEGGRAGMWEFCPGRVLHPPPPFTHHRLPGTHANEGERGHRCPLPVFYTYVRGWCLWISCCRASLSEFLWLVRTFVIFHIDRIELTSFCCLCRWNSFVTALMRMPVWCTCPCRWTVSFHHRYART